MSRENPPSLDGFGTEPMPGEQGLHSSERGPTGQGHGEVGRAHSWYSQHVFTNPLYSGHSEAWNPVRPTRYGSVPQRISLSVTPSYRFAGYSSSGGSCPRMSGQDAKNCRMDELLTYNLPEVEPWLRRRGPVLPSDPGMGITGTWTLCVRSWTPLGLAHDMAPESRTQWIHAQTGQLHPEPGFR